MRYLLHLFLNGVVGLCVRVANRTRTPFTIEIGGDRHLYAPHARELLNMRRDTWYDGRTIEPDLGHESGE